MIARALAKDPEARYPSAGDVGRASLAAADGRHVTESERTVARGAAAPPARPRTEPTAVLGAAAAPATNGRTAATALVPAPAPAPRTAHQPRETMQLGDRPRRRRGRRLARYAALLAGAGAIAFAATEVTGAGDDVDPKLLPGAPVADGEVERLVDAFAEAYADEDPAKLGRLLTRDAERVVPGARQEGRAAVVASYKTQFADSDTRSFEIEDLEPKGGETGRASGRYVATYEGDPDVTGTITFGVLRDRGTPRIALISARQDPPEA